ncbi:MAG: DUF167 family protein [Candidatus Nanoarchaeia archaeon]|nr:DUF167 family protein [Candidatus Nanoarchaeia archaeon]MDD5054091.1 DUF167 family protein [Candidatus Nanoarchaeia archaeon]MDD5499529.1 DUF167 family protein [Candidatus Nanoarchaeia archaeon]
MKIIVLAKTRQKKSELKKENEVYCAFLKSNPKNNEANDELIKLMEKFFNKKVVKITGSKSRKKIIELMD